MRKAREEEDKDLLALPIDPLVFGSDDDPCFGKLYDLTTKECKSCGDSEFCALKFNQLKNEPRRKKLEASSSFLDLEDAKELLPIKIRKYIRRCVRKDYSNIKIRKLIKNKFEFDDKQALNDYIDLAKEKKQTKK